MLKYETENIWNINFSQNANKWHYPEQLYWLGMFMFWQIAVAKGQLILKCLFGVFNFLQKTNKNKSHSRKIEFLCSFFGGNFGLKKSFWFCQTFEIQENLHWYYPFDRLLSSVKTFCQNITYEVDLISLF